MKGVVLNTLKSRFLTVSDGAGAAFIPPPPHHLRNLIRVSSDALIPLKFRTIGHYGDFLYSVLSFVHK